MILDPNEMLQPVWEPVQKSRFIFYMDGFPAYMIKGATAIGYDQGEIKLNHINSYRKIKGKLEWKDITLTLFDPIAPSGAQAVMEWTRLHYETVTGRAGYSDFYKKDCTMNMIGPPGDIIREWTLKGAFIKSMDMGDYSWDSEAEAQQITLTLGLDGAILEY